MLDQSWIISRTQVLLREEYDNFQACLRGFDNSLNSQHSLCDEGKVVEWLEYGKAKEGCVYTKHIGLSRFSVFVLVPHAAKMISKRISGPKMAEKPKLN